MEKGVGRKFYLTTTLEETVQLAALLDTAAKFTLMSTELFTQVQATIAKRKQTL